MSKIRLNTDWLTVCGGCHVALVDLHDKILEVMGAIEIQHCPLLTDTKDYPHADIGLLSGAIRNQHDVEVAHKMRASCDTLIAYGTCAVYGGIPGAALAHSPEEILDRVYVNNPTTRTTHIPETQVARLEKQVTPVDEIVPVDLYLAGCPPHAAFIFDALISLTRGRPPKARGETVCGRCTRRMVRSKVEQLQAFHEGLPNEEECLLSQGYICLGSATLDRCLAPCPSRGVACGGCAGPSLPVLTEPNRDLRSEVAERMARLTKIPRQEIVDAMERDAKSHYAYAMATRMIGEKPTFLINKWIAEVETEV